MGTEQHCEQGTRQEGTTPEPENRSNSIEGSLTISEESTPTPDAELNFWDAVRPRNVDLTEPEEMKSHELEFGDVFQTRNTVWLHCGWYSAVRHTQGFSAQKSRTVIAHVEPVRRVRKATPEEQEALKAYFEKHCG